MGVDAARLEPTGQPEAITAGLEGDYNALDPGHGDQGVANSVREFCCVQLERLLCRRPNGLYVGYFELDGELARGAERVRLAQPRAADRHIQPNRKLLRRIAGRLQLYATDQIVVGGEVDATFPTFLDRNGISTGGITNLTSPTLGAETYGETVLASGTVRGRIGYAAPGSWLFYATGGFAWTYDQQLLTRVATGANKSPFLWRLGYAAGAGVDAPVAPHWTARLKICSPGTATTAPRSSAARSSSLPTFPCQQVRAS